MAGGKITRIVGGTNSIECESWTVYTDEFKAYAGEFSHFTADKGIHIGEPKEPPPAGKHFIKGWWTDDENKPITEALFGDTVRFHIEMQDTTTGDEVFLSLYDDDNKVKPLEEDHEDDEKKLAYTVNGQPVISDKVNKNKVIKQIILKNFEDLLADEKDGEIELYFKCKYKDEEVSLPDDFGQYLKVTGMPKIIFVNGQWRVAKYSLGEMVGPTQPKKPYWYDGEEMINSARDYFDLNDKYYLGSNIFTNKNLENKNIILYYDGSSYAGADQSGKDRFENGRKFAEENFEEITKGLGGNKIYFISHSEGGAYAAGMADFLHNKGIIIGEHIMLSTDEANDFSVNPDIPSYQLTYMYFASKKSITPYLLSPEIGSLRLSFKSWGDYYAVVDWVVGEHIVKGTQKSGIVFRSDLDWQGVHGSTNDTDIFNELKDLKNVKVIESVGMVDENVYTATDQTKVAKHTKFYKIDDTYIMTNCPPIYKIKKK